MPFFPTIGTGEYFLVFYPSLAYNQSMIKIPHIIVETESFLTSASKLWSENERDAFKLYIGLNVLEGDLVPGTGGLRKVRWSRAGTGKRGGVRVIYYYYDGNAPLYLLFAYPKGVKDDLTAGEKEAFRAVVEVLKKQCKDAKKRVKV